MSLSKFFSYFSFQQKLFDTICTVINTWPPGRTDCDGVRFPDHGGGVGTSPQSVLLGPVSTDNSVHGTEKVLLKIQVSEDFA